VIDARRHDLDWIRAIAICSVVLFHAAVPFTAPIYGLEGLEVSGPLYEFCFFFNQWRMPLLFCVSGGATWIALERRTGQRFLAGRAQRLLIPLAVGVFILLPPVHWRSDGAGQSFFEFYPRTFEVTFSRQYVNWAHLWFIAYLFAVDVIALPALLWLRGPAGARCYRRIALALTRPGAVAALAIPLAVVACVPSRWVGDWSVLGLQVKPLGSYLLLYGFGYALAASEGVRAALVARRHEALVVAVVVQALRYALRWLGGHPPGSMPPDVLDPMVARAGLFVGAVTAWLWVVVVLSYAARYLQFENAVLRYLRSRSYAMYLVHQPVLVVLAAPVLYSAGPVGARFGVLALATGAITLAVYELVIKRSDAARFLLGVAPRRARRPGGEPETARGGNERRAA
jgi:peptidoglycan/LPS O-acetylase OafA/YrhL